MKATKAPIQQKLLYGEECNHTYMVVFQINGGGPFAVEESGTVAIRFVNGKFESVQFPFHGTYTRNGWRILAAIEAEITKAEARFAKETPQSTKP